MKLFGIPIGIIIIFIIWAIVNQYEENKKKKKQALQKWDTITTGMSKDEVIGKLGKPHRVLQVGMQEAWGFGPTDSDGAIMFVDGKITAYRKPS